MKPESPTIGWCGERHAREHACQIAAFHGVSMTFPESPEAITAKA